MLRPLPAVAVAAALLLSAAAAPPLPSAPATDLYLVADRDLDGLAATVVHDYGATSLVHLSAPPAVSPASLRRLADGDRVGFRWWQASLATAAALPPDGPPTVVVLALVGPPDAAWRGQLAACGLEILAPAHPAALVVRADREQLLAAGRLATSHGFAVVRGVVPLPQAARLARELARRPLAALGPTPLRLRSFVDPTDTTAVLDGHALADRLAADDDLAYVEPLRRVVFANDLAAGPETMAAAAVWSELGLNGRDIVVAHNDTGVDLGHPDLPPEAIVATAGRMSYTDSSHGTHTAGSVAGRGGALSPLNTSGCGDLVTPQPTVRGLAWASRLAVNNIVAGGFSEVAAMMAWGHRQGASVSTNSWGLSGPTGVVTTYGAAAVAADRAVRDADPEAAGEQSLTVLVAAGNLGPVAGTVTEPGTAKNVITVGASQSLRCGVLVPAAEPGPDPTRVLAMSGRGPSQGRLKPELVAPGSDLLSLESADPDANVAGDQEWTGPLYRLSSGTSMACPLAAGAAAVVHEWHWRARGVLPSAALTRAALVAGARDLGQEPTAQGWGLVDLAQTVNGPPGGSVIVFDQGDSPSLTTGANATRTVEVLSTSAPLTMVLAWSDVPGEEDADHPLVNDLDLVVTAPDGTWYRGNRLVGGWSEPRPGSAADDANNLEVVRVTAPAAGSWQITVTASQVLIAPPGLAGQDFALAVSGAVLACSAASPPLAVTANAVADNQVVVAWAPVVGAERYRVRRATTAGGRPYLPLGEVDGAATELGDGDVSGGVSYYYVVEARVAGCWSAPSAEAAVTASGACRLPPAFTGLATAVAVAGTTCAAELSWPAATAACAAPVTYAVYRGPGPEVTVGPATLVASGLTGTSFTDLGLAPDHEVAYSVRATNPVSGADDGNRVSHTVTPRGAAESLLVDDGEVGPTRWRSGPVSSTDQGATAFALDDDDAHSPAHAWHAADAAAVTDQALTLAVPLAIPRGAAVRLHAWQRYRLQGGRDGGRLEYSSDGGLAWHDILAGDGVAVVADPDRITSGGYTHTLALGGNDNPLAGAAAWSGASTGWEELEVDLAAFAGARLLLRFRLGLDQSVAVDGGWWLDDLVIELPRACQSCLGPSPPAAVTAVAAADGVAVAWTAVAAAHRYRVERADGAGAPFLPVAEVSAGESLLDAAVSGGTTYRYRVAADAGCWSDPSAAATATATGPCLLPPWFWGLDRATDHAAASCGVDLEWRPGSARCPGPAPAYRLLRSPGPSFDDSLATVVGETTATVFTDPTVSDGTTVSYRVHAVDRRSGVADDNHRDHAVTVRGETIAFFADDLESGPDHWLTAAGSSADSGTAPWQLVDDLAASPTHAWFVADENRPKDQVLVLADELVVATDTAPTLSFWHFFDLEPFWDGGVLEYSLDGGASWHDIAAGDGSTIPADPDRLVTGRYSATLSVGSASNPLAGRAAWTGALTEWEEVEVDLAAFAGLPLHLRLRLGCDDSRARSGWWVDDVRIDATAACVSRGPRRAGERAP